MTGHGERGWRPILEGAEAERAVAAAREIADALPAPGEVDGGDPALAGGDAGVALLHAWLARADAGDGGRAGPHLDAAIDALATVPLPTSLYSGFSGVAWSAELLQGGAPDGEDDFNAEIDEALLTHVGQSPWTTHYDLVSGPVGLAVYALERLPRPSAAALLAEIVARLEETAVRMPGGGIAWHTAWDLLPEHQRRTFARGHFNLGVAHGVPGVVSVLGQAVAAGVAADRARPLLRGAVEWLLAQELPAKSPSRFAYSAADEVEATPARAAWCYGDPGIAAALLVAARGAGEEAWEREALRIARSAARRPDEDAGVVDAGLCHGAAGLALVYDRVFQATGDEEVRDAARRWTLRALELRRPGEGVAGFRSWGPPRGGGPSEWLDDPGLLTGAAGVALALLAAATPVEPEWDRFLLVSSRHA
ncbi:MAG: lanthionine synthetase C family protein [Gemmatimonadota bacterium]